MAEFLWTFAVTETLKKVVKLAAGQIGRLWNLEKDLEKLRNQLVVSEELLRGEFKESPKKLVEDLHEIVLEAEDLLDELVYEHLRQKVENAKMEGRYSFSVPFVHNFLFRTKVANKLKEIMERLRENNRDLGLLNPSHKPSTETQSMVGEPSDWGQLLETTSQLDEGGVVGRDSEVSSLVDQVVGANQRQVNSILPIVGMGGSGKTTLAKLLFHHHRIKAHFDKTIWVCVSEPFVINRILQAILQNLEDHPSDCSNNREALLGKLRRKMDGKRYFLVLDDVWNEDKMNWEKLMECLMTITEKSGNSILVTTRSTEGANVMKQELDAHQLCRLAEDQCWALFVKSANANEVPMTPDLELVREELVKKIGGIPLVAKVLGRAVQFPGDHDQWVTMLRCVVTTPLKKDDFVTFTLKLSVDRLPKPSIKQCFAYCSNFPKDFEFEKEELIQMWMAQGFTQPEEGNNETMEEIGNRYFNILLSRCLFQDVEYDEGRRIISCKMHDLIHDIACDISNHRILMQLDHCKPLNWELWTKEDKKDASKLRTVTFFDNNSNWVKPRLSQKVIHDKIVEFVGLRVLIVNSMSVNELPDSICKLKHLRYLDISHTDIRKIPESIVLLYNLQTLRFSVVLYELPENLRKLVSLRHLVFYRLKQMPAYLSQLIQLQTLPRFRVGFEKGRKITELGPMRNLKGSLILQNLERVGSQEEAKNAKLVEKEKLHQLGLFWRSQDHSEVKHHNDLEVLEGLQPHKNLRHLVIDGFLGGCFPNKIFSENLVRIRLVSGRHCEKLPMLGQLTNLETLQIIGFPKVHSIGNEFYGNYSNQRTLFPKLEHLILRQMQNLVQWEQVTDASNVATFPYLKNLRIIGCKRLLKIPDLFGYCDENGEKHLKVVIIRGCDQLKELPNGLQYCDSIQHLEIDPA